MREELDKKLADKGWQSMQQLLERDMPEDRKRRPFAWWWLGGLLLLPIAIFGGRLWWQTEHRKPAEPLLPAVLKTERPVVQQSTDRQPGKASESALNVPAGTASAQTEKSAANTASVAPKLAAASRPMINAATAAPASAQPVIPTTTAQRPADEHVATTSGQVVSMPVAPIAAQEITLSETVSAEAVPEDFVTLDLLETPLQAVEKENTASLTTRTFPAYTAEKPVIQPSKNTPRWAFGLSVAASTEYFESVNTISGGVTTDWRFARKFGLRSSVLFTRYRPTPSRQPVVAVEEVRYTNATGLYTGAYPTPSQDLNSEDDQYVYIPIRKLYQMEMPLLAWWQPNRMLRVYSGVSLAYTFFGQSAQQNYIDNALVFLDTNSSQKSASQIATEQLNRLQVQYQGGLGLRLGRHAELSAFWQAPIRNIFPKRYDLASYNSATEQLNDPALSINGSSLQRVPRLILQGTWLF